MIKRNVRKSLLKRVLSMAIFIVLCLSMSVLAYAVEVQVYDMTDALTIGVNSLSVQVFGIIAVIVPVIITIIGAKLAVIKGLSVFKSLVAKG